MVVNACSECLSHCKDRKRQMGINMVSKRGVVANISKMFPGAYSVGHVEIFILRLIRSLRRFGAGEGVICQLWGYLIWEEGLVRKEAGRSAKR